jgi:hypothetical protein
MYTCPLNVNITAELSLLAAGGCVTEAVPCCRFLPVQVLQEKPAAADVLSYLLSKVALLEQTALTTAPLRQASTS